MITIKLPLNKVLKDGALKSIATELNILCQVDKQTNGDYIILSINNQESIESVLTHDNIILIVANGGEIEGYTVYAGIPAIVNGESIYTQEVPEGLQHRQLKICTGSSVNITTKVLGQWVNSNIKQKFSPDYSTIYLSSNPLGDLLKASELKIFVDTFGAQLYTLSQYKTLITKEL